MSTDRREDTDLPEWIHELEQDFGLPEWVWRTEHVRAACEANLPPVEVWRKLLWYSGLPFGPRSTALWLSTYCGGKDKLRALGKVQGSRVHCFPKAAQLAKRCGLSERRVRDHLQHLEAAGWLLIERHRKAPSDYWLAIPDVTFCPCGCEDETSGQGDESSGHSADVTSGHSADESSGALGSGSRGSSSLDSGHGRSPSSGSDPGDLEDQGHDPVERRRRFIAELRANGYPEGKVQELEKRWMTTDANGQGEGRDRVVARQDL